MIVSVNELIGSLIYRTMLALNKDEAFMNGIKEYYYYPTIVGKDGTFHLWHFPGTQQEIGETFKELGKDSLIGSKLKFPSLLNFQDIMQEYSGNGLINVRFNLAFVAPVLSDWTTQERDKKAFKPILRPVYEEFKRQVKKSIYFQNPMGEIPHIYMEVFTTGKSITNEINMYYGDYMDAIQLTNFTLKVKENICTKNISQIEEESKKVTESIKNLK